MNKMISRWIEENIYSNLSIDDVSRYTGLCRRSVQHRFKREFNIPLGEYIRKRKLSRAAVLLMLTSAKITDIAVLLHYSSHQNFIRAFRFNFGLSPEQYRLRNRGRCLSIMLPDEFSTVVIREIKVVHLNMLLIEGQRLCHSQTLTHNVENNDEDILFTELINAHAKYHSEIYQISEFSLDIKEKTIDNTINIKTITGGLSQYSFSLDNHCIPAESYICFSFYGTWREFKLFNKKIYCEDLSLHGWQLCWGYHVSVFSFGDSSPHPDIPFKCDCFIPFSVLLD